MTEVYNVVLVTRNARDKVQVARYILEQEGNVYTIKRFTGQFGGKITAQPELTITAGKAKRTPFQQADLEFNSLIKKATDKGYKKLASLTKTKFSDITGGELDLIVPSIKTDSFGVIKPQLAKSSGDCSTSVLDKSYFASRKIDGVRAMFRYDEENDCIKTSSRGGGEYDVSTTDIRENEQLLELFRNNPTLILDGEIYVHGWSLQKISGTTRLKTYEDRCSKLEFWVFDYVDSEKSFNNRLDYLVDLSIDFKDNPKVKILEHEYVEGWTKIKKLHDKYVQEGFEGLVLRKPTGNYEAGKRNSSWIKVKERLDGEFEILGVEEGLRPEDMCFILTTTKGKSFKAKPVGSRELREEYLENWKSLKGKKGTCTFFTWSDDGTPIQPVFKCVREEGE